MNFLTLIIEYFRSWLFFRHLKPCITVLGSARFMPDNPYYQKAYTIAKRLAEQNFVIMTGAGPSVMEAANKGAKEAGGLSIGCYTHACPEELINDYLDKRIAFTQLTTRKIALINYSNGFVIFPGGFGTLDELFELLVLCQSQKMKKKIILIGQTFWQPLLAYFKQTLLAEKTISPKDLSYVYVTDSVEDAVREITSC